MAVEFDAVTTRPNQVGNDTWAHTCAADATLLIVGFCHTQQDVGPGIIDSVTYAAVALTKLVRITTSNGNELAVELWYLENPSTGANNIVVTTEEHGVIVAASYSGSRSENALGTYATNDSASATSLGATVIGYDGGINVAVGGTMDDIALGVGTTQTERGEAQHTDRCSGNLSDKVGSGNVYLSFSHVFAARHMAIVVVPILPAEAGLERAVAYYFDIWDPEQKILDAMGRRIPPWEVHADRWIRVTGVMLPTTEVYDSLVDDPECAYIESVAYDDESGALTIKTSRGELGEVILARASGRKTM